MGHITYTVGTVFKDHPWEVNTLVFVHGWSLITGSFIQKIRIWDSESVFALDRELLFQGGLWHRFNYMGKLEGLKTLLINVDDMHA